MSKLKSIQYLPVENRFSSSRAWRSFQIFLKTQFECLADGCNDVLRQSTSAFEDVTRTAVNVVFGHVGNEIQRILFHKKTTMYKAFTSCANGAD